MFVLSVKKRKGWKNVGWFKKAKMALNFANALYFDKECKITEV